ncbi:MAG: CpaD family pilus assembly protein [Caulobacteraceae bacterium]
MRGRSAMSSNRTPFPAILALAASSACLVLCACAGGADPAGPEALTPTEQFAIAVKGEPRELRLGVHAFGVSENQARALSAFALDWRNDEGGPVTIEAPLNGTDATAAWRTASDARQILLSAGLDPAMVRTTRYAPPPGEAGVVVVAYHRLVAEGPTCRAWTDFTAEANRVNSNFGCAVTADIAAQIANPRDLLRPEPMTPPDAGRRQSVIDKYRAGEVTSSAENKQASGAVSTAIQ